MSDYQRHRLQQKINGKEVPQKKRKWLKRSWVKKKVADKRVVENEIYEKRRNSYLAKHPYCQCGCGRIATQIHHKRGRKGKYRGESLLIVVKFFMAVSDYCHKKIHRDIEWATKKGFLLKRNIKSEKQPIMKRCTVLLVAIVVACSLSAQTTAQDSIAKEQAKVNKFVDSVMAKTSLKDFQTFLDESVTLKQFREGTFQQLQNFFIQTKYNQWIQSQAQKGKKPPN